ncbi:hypothetical protein ARAM_004936 [Aspergillus rambellii]|uniref:Cell wall mannoprotein 1 n=2 Tax=Aspergillus subgen. Nidulantes TaxID=2720870 RepID=A0A0F8U654_9EURO|nr:hypothetical protein ARAM_004936 [Aspergillus rambellii]KKK17063.1 hypothetical protein AOCH_002506 [Aspergillus ochraceoroseus]
MKATAFLSLFLASTAVLAAPTKVTREPSAIEERANSATQVLAAIGTKVVALNSAITSCGPAATIPQTRLRSTTPGALALTGPVQDLTKEVGTTVDDIVAKKQAVVAATVGGVTKTSLNDQYAAAEKLSKALTAKVPDALSGIAAQLSAGITDAIQKGIDAYDDVSSS